MPTTNVADDDAVASLRKRVRKRVAQGDFELPVLPETATRVMSLCRGDDSDPHELADLIKSDPTLTALIMRLVNSAAFAPISPVVSLPHAISRLGMARVAQMALMVAMKNRLFVTPGYESRLRALFRHSLIAAGFAAEIARIKRTNVDDAYQCGLMHDLGKPVLIQLAVDVAADLDGELPSAELEALIAEMHEEVGAALVASWNMPASLRAALAYHHHSPELAGAHENAARMTRLADEMAKAVDLDDEAFADFVAGHADIGVLLIHSDDVAVLVGSRPGITAYADELA